VYILNFFWALITINQIYLGLGYRCKNLNEHIMENIIDGSLFFKRVT